LLTLSVEYFRLVHSSIKLTFGSCSAVTELQTIQYPTTYHLRNMLKPTRSMCAGITSTLVRRPLNTAVVQGSVVTLQCSSDVNSPHVLIWYNSTCVERNITTNCVNDAIYIISKVKANFKPKFHVTAVNNATHVTRDLNIMSTQLTDAGVYLCAEQRPGIRDVLSSSAQLIVLGNYNWLHWLHVNV